MGKIVDWLLEFLYKLASIVLSILPDSPFQTDSFKDGLSNFSDIMGHINYFVPVGDFVTILSGFLAVTIIWYGARWILRLAQYID